MSKIFAIVRREFIERVRQRWFWVMALLGPVLFGALFILPGMLMSKGSLKHIVVVDETTNGFGAAVVPRFDSTKIRAVRMAATPRLIDSLTQAVSAKTLDGFLILTDAVVDSGKAEYRASNVSAITTIEEIKRTLRSMGMLIRLQREGVDSAAIGRAQQVGLDLTTMKIEGGKATSESTAESFSLAYFMGIILYMAILLYGINVMSSVLEEKTNRIVEVLISSVKPFQLMAGKVIGVGAVSLFQFVIWGILGRSILRYRRSIGAETAGQDAGLFTVPHVTPETAVVFLIYFIGGFMLYSAMFASVGAMSSNEQEARQAQQPVSMLLVVSFLGMFGMLNDPGSTFSVALSMIPFTSPIAMPVRWAAGNLPFSEVALSVAILAASIVGVTWVAARIYRVGILMTGKRPSPKELLRWIKTA